MHNRIVVYSGGMDSFTLLHKVLRESKPSMELPPNHLNFMKFYALSFDYNQRHGTRELEMAVKVCSELGITHEIISLPALGIIAKGSALTDGRVAVPHEHYSHESIKKTVVPGRNTVMLAMALAFAEGLRASSPDPSMTTSAIYYGAHADDHATYPDCRPEYIQSMVRSIALASDTYTVLRAPFQNMTKAAILAEGVSIGIPLPAYRDTWTCYEGGLVPCKECGTCIAREEAFAINGFRDPLMT